MFHIFFDNMTTLMVEMEIYLSNFPSSYDAIPGNLSIFKVLYLKNKDSAFIKGSKKKASAPRTKKKKSLTDKGNIKHTEKLIKILNWNITRFVRE